jgi:hypothetical protein
MSENPNDYQIGGSHYQAKGKMQHWDIMLWLGCNYFQGVVTKYLYRFENKNGEEDLRKALHFLTKYQGVEYTPTHFNRKAKQAVTELGIGLESTVGQAMVAVFQNNTKIAIRLVSKLIEEKYGDSAEATSAYTNQD